MSGKRSVGRASLLLCVIMVFGFFFATYNFITMVMQDRAANVRSLMLDSSHEFGPLIPVLRKVIRSSNSDRKFHVVVTATDAPYSQWQCRVMYYWYKKFKDEPGSDMGGFTRVLHSGRADHLMEEIPTFVVDPLPDGLDQGYIVLNRPWAFVQWLEKATIDEDFIFMGEPDHIFMNPLPNLAWETYSAGYPFFYIKPAQNEKIIRKFYPEEKGPVTDVDPIGNSPAIITKSLLTEIAPTWLNISLRMKNDPEADHAFGWVQEMYAYAVASALHGIKHGLHKDFMLQPPWDLEVGRKFILHYTYGCDYNKKGELTYGQIGDWRFDKRQYLSGPPPKNLSLPPPGVPESVVRLVKMVNEASANIPGWDVLQVHTKSGSRYNIQDTSNFLFS